MSHIRFAASLLIVVVTCAGSAAAQDRPRGFIGLNGGYQASTTEFDDNFTFTAHQETGTTRVSYPIDAGPAFDAGAGIRVWRRLGVGVAVSRFTIDSTVSATSSIPHPFFLRQNREVSGEADGIRREETGIHVQAQYSVPLGRRLQLTLMAGPSLLQVSQAVVIDVNYTEEYPYDTASFSGVDSTRKKGSKAGFNAGADVRWMFTRNIGVGMMARFARATVDLDPVDDRTITVDAGGAQVGVGLRVGF
jgi:opacity protein-like surface antigen